MVVVTSAICQLIATLAKHEMAGWPQLMELLMVSINGTVRRFYMGFPRNPVQLWYTVYFKRFIFIFLS